jgi:hypothetical protein
LTVKAIGAGCKHSKVFRGIVIFVVSLAFVFLVMVMVIISPDKFALDDYA